MRETQQMGVFQQPANLLDSSAILRPRKRHMGTLVQRDELCSRKLRMYPELKQRIISVDIEGMEDGLKVAVVSIDGPTSRCT